MGVRRAMMFRNFICIFICYTFMTGACGYINQEELEKKLSEKRHQFEFRFNTEDNVGLAQLYTSDATVLPFRHPKVTGTQGIVEYLAALHRSGMVGVSLEPHALLPLTQGACGVDPASLAYSYVAERGTFRFYGKLGVYRLRGEYMLAWRVYESGDARIHWDIFNEVFEADDN